jgi:hypothetical protein
LFSHIEEAAPFTAEVDDYLMRKKILFTIKGQPFHIRRYIPHNVRMNRKRVEMCGDVRSAFSSHTRRSRKRRRRSWLRSEGL